MSQQQRIKANKLNLIEMNNEIILQKNGNCSYYKCIIKTKIKAKIIEKYCRKNNIQITLIKFPVTKSYLNAQIETMNNKYYLNYKIPKIRVGIIPTTSDTESIIGDRIC